MICRISFLERRKILCDILPTWINLPTNIWQIATITEGAIVILRDRFLPRRSIVAGSVGIED
jgi:hypothetical protein